MTTADSNPSVSQPAVQEVELGAESTFAELPYPLAIGQDDFFLVKDKGGAYHLLSGICPHSWGRIVRWDTCFMCPDHGWRFEMSEGICVNGPNARMYRFPVTARDGQLYAAIPEDMTTWE